jgi:S1-C subfamily serine protease
MIWLWALALAVGQLAFVGTAGSASAQTGPAWIQLQALPDLTSAEQSARSFGAGLGADAGAVAGFRLGARWYIVTLGPFEPAQAAGKMAALKAEGRIPRDAFITDGAEHGAQFWPAGGTAAPQASDAAVPQADAVIPDETVAEAQATEAALAKADKISLQSALQWFGFYNGGLDGAFGPGTRTSMAAWQTAFGYSATGVLTTQQRAVLMGNYQAEESAFGFETITEAEAGIEIALPAAMLEFDRFEPPFVRYREKGGSGMQLLLISEPGDETTLAGLYEQLQSLEVVPAQGARALEGGEFTITAQGAEVSAFATARASKGTIKGFLLIWPAQQDDAAQRALGIMRASFRSISDQVLDPGLVPLDETLRAGIIAGMQVKAPTSRISGVFVDDAGLVLTAAEGVAMCGQITIDGATDAEIVASDAATGAAILRPLSPVAPIAVARLSAAAALPQAQVLMAGYSLPTGLPAPVLTTAEVQSLTGPSGEAGLITLSATVTPHDLGGPVLDGSGALVAMLRGTQVGGKTMPAGTTLALPADLIAPLIAQAGGSATRAAAQTELAPDALNAAAMGMTVQVACWP